MDEMFNKTLNEKVNYVNSVISSYTFLPKVGYQKTVFDAMNYAVSGEHEITGKKGTYSFLYCFGDISIVSCLADFVQISGQCR